MEVVENIALITINATLVFQLLSFLLFLFIIHRVMIRPLDRVMQERNFFLERLNEEIEEAGEEYDQVHQQIARQEKAARDEAYAIRHGIESSGAAKAEEMIARTLEEIDALKSEAQRETAEKVRKARDEAQIEAVSVAQSMITSVLARQVEF